MSVRVACPSCGEPFEAGDERAGAAVSCPACGAAVSVPRADALAPVEAVEMVEDGSEAEELPIAEPVPAPAVPIAEPPRVAPVRRDSPRPAASHKLRDEPPPESSGLGGAVLVLSLAAAVCLLCCGGFGFGVYWLFQQAADPPREAAGDRGEKNDRVTVANYKKLELGMTSAEVEAILGPGQIARASPHLDAAFPNNSDLARKRRAEWLPKVGQGRVLVWVNGDDHLFVAFHGRPNSGGHLQMKEFVVRNGAGEHDGIPDDAEFARQFGPPGKPKDKRPAIEVSAFTLVMDYRDDASADPKYKGKELTVTSAVFESVTGDTAIFRENVKTLIGTRLQVHFTPGQREKLEALQRGDSVKFRAVCEGRSGRVITMDRGYLIR